jgi:hypothetical protein
MGLNLSNHQIAQELDLNKDDVQQMTSQLRAGIVLNKPEVQLSGAVECDEVYVIAGHKGQPEVVKKSGCIRLWRGEALPAEVSSACVAPSGRKGRVRRLKPSFRR